MHGLIDKLQDEIRLVKRIDLITMTSVYVIIKSTLVLSTQAYLSTDSEDFYAESILD